MTRLLGALSPRSWLRRPRRTARLRLTLLYTGMFLGLGTALVFGIFLLSSAASRPTPTPRPSGDSDIDAIRPVPPDGLGLALRGPRTKGSAQGVWARSPPPTWAGSWPRRGDSW